MADASVEEVRAQVDAILDRARNDPQFGARLDDNPQSTLREAGLDGRAIAEVAQEIGDIKRQNKPDTQRPCDYTTCWISWCDHWGTFRTSG